MILEAITRIKAERTISPLEKSIRQRIEDALHESVYPALLEAVHHAPIDGPSIEWAIRVISSVAPHESEKDTA